MLDSCTEPHLMTQLWDAANEHAVLPQGEEDGFFEFEGPMVPAIDDRRRRRRYFYRQRAVLKVGSGKPLVLGVYCRDLSQSGVGFVSPRQLLPYEQARLILSPERVLSVRVRNCRRQGEKCFVVGCDFETAETGGPSLWD